MGGISDVAYLRYSYDGDDDRDGDDDDDGDDNGDDDDDLMMMIC